MGYLHVLFSVQDDLIRKGEVENDVEETETFFIEDLAQPERFFFSFPIKYIILYYIKIIGSFHTHQTCSFSWP